MDDKEFTASSLGIKRMDSQKKVSMNELNGILTIEFERVPGVPLECSKCGMTYLSRYDHYQSVK